MLTLTTFGVPQLRDAAGGEIQLGKQEMALLVYLAVEHHQPHGRDFLGDLLSAETKDPRGLVNSYLSRLRRKLPDGCIQGRDAPRVAGISCDAVLLANAAAGRGASGWEVLQLYRGRFLDQFYPGKHAAGFGVWASSKAADLQKQMKILWQHEIRAALDGSGGWARVRELGIWGLETDSEWVEALARLMKAEIELGNPEAALVWADPVLARLRRKPPLPRQLDLLHEEAGRRVRGGARETAPPGPDAREGSRGEILDPRHVERGGSVAATRAEVYDWDLFVASPMDAFPTDQGYEDDQRTVTALVGKQWRARRDR